MQHIYENPYKSDYAGSDEAKQEEMMDDIITCDQAHGLQISVLIEHVDTHEICRQLDN